MTSVSAKAFRLQESPLIYVTSLPGQWLLRHTTPVWRIKNPVRGFQRMVKEPRARAIAVAVLDQRRTFPNAIILATDRKDFGFEDCTLRIPRGARFLVVDGQHRLWAQTFSEHEARYACVIHVGLRIVDMAKLFLEINDNQKRVPSSLRWDLVRLVRPEHDAAAVRAAELTHQLATEEESPLYQRIDLTGEQKQITLKQGSLAPELKSFVTTRTAGIRDLDFETQYELLVRYLAAIKSRDPDGWKQGDTPLYKARVLRALIRLLPHIAGNAQKPPEGLSFQDLKIYLDRIDVASLAAEEIQAIQGSAGMKEIFDQLSQQVLPR